MKTLTFILLVYVGFGLCLFLLQRYFLYFPTPNTTHPYHEEIYHFDDASIKVVALNKQKQKAILYFGGNAEAVEYNASNFKRIFPNHAIYLVKYRGYGGSTGQPNEKDIYADALKIFDDLAQKHSKISVIGRSLGTGVATRIAAKRNIEKLVLVSPYDSIQSVAQKTYPIYPMSLLLKDKYNAIASANSITAPTLVFIAENDKTIKKIHSEKLIKAFPVNKIKVVTINNTGHNTIINHSEYNKLLGAFINQ
jgi:pimeloyl-ACP methyl ester carboxylesterase